MFSSSDMVEMIASRALLARLPYARHWLGRCPTIRADSGLWKYRPAFHRCWETRRSVAALSGNTAPIRSPPRIPPWTAVG